MVSLDFPNVHTYITLGISSNHATTCEIWGKKKRNLTLVESNRYINNEADFDEQDDPKHGTCSRLQL